MGTHIHTAQRRHTYSHLLMMGVLLAAIVILPHFGHAQDQGVCGDGKHTEDEECDDGNLTNGDGCNNQCLLEICGDGRLMEPEQCDDGNTINGDGCSAQCFIEFCGDGILQELRGEECDDGNTISGDGCSNQCLLEELPPGYCERTEFMEQVFETANLYFQELQGGGSGIQGGGNSGRRLPSWTEEEMAFIEEQLGLFFTNAPILCEDFERVQRLNRKFIVIPVDGPNTVRGDPLNANPPLRDTGGGGGGELGGGTRDRTGGGTRGTREEEIKKATEFLGSAMGDGILSRLTQEGKDRLRLILEKYEQGRGLTEEEIRWIQSLSIELHIAKEAEKKLYTDLLDRFISTDISLEVLRANQLLRERLVFVEVPIAIQELERAVAIVERGELRQEVQAAIAKLRRQRVHIDDTPIEISDSFSPSRRPIEVFAALTHLKDEAESIATLSIPSSADIVVQEIDRIRSALPLLEKHYLVDQEEIETLLRLIEVRAQTVNQHSAERFVATVNRLIAVLERHGIQLPNDSLAVALTLSDSLARAEKITTQHAPRTLVASLTDRAKEPREQLDALSRVAPKAYAPAFRDAETEQQRSALVEFLRENKRVSSLRERLRDRGEPDDTEFFGLIKEIRRVGVLDMPDTSCDDTIQSAIDCADAYLATLQTKVRSASLWLRIVGGIQDFFGM